jgi:predicted nucleic-acid-binding Zn-ribbon protein
MRSSDKACRNCGSTEWFSQEVDAKGGYGPDLLPIGFFSAPKFHIRVCGGCGLVEWFVSPKYLSKVKEKFPRET